MNLFFKKLFGGLESTEKMEAREAQLFADLIHYKRFENSDEYAEYKRLFEIVKSAEFKEKRKTLKTRKYKDTLEYRELRRFDKLDRNSDIKLYYHILKSDQLSDYLAFKETDEYLKLGDKRELKKSPKLKEYKKFEKSKNYKNYVRFHNSFPVQEYERLKEKISTDEFKKANAFWENPNRWNTTEEYVLKRKFYDIVDSEDGKFFFSTDPKKFKDIENLQVYIKDYFKYKNLDESKWKACFYYTNTDLKSVHSFTDEKQANSGGKNISTGNGLKIFTRKQKAVSPAWDKQKGFVEKEYEYTADVVNGHDIVEESYCSIRTKMRVKGKVNHAFWLTSGNKLPHINIAMIKGRKIEVGVYDARGDYYYTKIRGINPNKYYIYSVFQSKDELIWKINNIEVFRTRNIISGHRFFPVFNSFIPKKRRRPTEGELDVEWLEVYK